MGAKIERLPLHQLKPGQAGDFFAVLCEKARRSTREGKPFFGLKFRDRVRTAAVMVWDNSPLFAHCETAWQTGQHFKIRGTYQEHQRYGPQLEIQQIRLAIVEDRLDGYDPDALVLTTRFDVDELFAELRRAADSIGDQPLRHLVVTLLTEHEATIRVYPAARRHHHAFRGGFLEHTVSVLRTGIYLAEKYAAYYDQLSPPLNRDLIVAGCILHDIGKLHELRYDEMETIYTVPGELIGHILIGRDMVRDAAKKIPELNPELLLYLEHIIVAHQGLREWDSPKEPMLPEAFLVHHADDIDAKMNMFVHIIGASEGEDSFTDQGNVLRRKLLRRRNV